MRHQEGVGPGEPEPWSIGGMNRFVCGDGDQEHQWRLQHQNGELEEISAMAKSWDSEAVVKAYRSAAGGGIQRLSMALFAQAFPLVEAARISESDREKSPQRRVGASLESQVRGPPRLCVMYINIINMSLKALQSVFSFESAQIDPFSPLWISYPCRRRIVD